MKIPAFWAISGCNLMYSIPSPIPGTGNLEGRKFCTFLNYTAPAGTLEVYTYPTHVGVILPTGTILRRGSLLFHRENPKKPSAAIVY